MGKAYVKKTKDFNPGNCGVTYCLNKIGGKWKALIIHLIRNNTNRYSTLQKAIPEASRQTLVTQLRELETDNIIRRTAYAEMPPRVEYSITEFGETLFPIIDAMRAWGRGQMDLRDE